MPSFKHRSYQKELLDRDDIPFDEIKKNMQELDRINHYLGGHAVSLEGLKKIIKDTGHGPLSILEIGSGGGDNLRAIRDWALKNRLEVELTGVDINPECIGYAGTLADNRGIGFFCSDYQKAVLPSRPDIIFSSLFCHHFTDEELVVMLRWMQENSSRGFFINDLHRHPLAYFSIRMLTRLFSKSRLVKNDAPLSVQRGFKRKDWIMLFKKAGIGPYECRWRWAFRWLVTCTANATRSGI
jgi:2-polyprenyl-3-methyl-5-hydroxy-6-metoxy-1,4-benzoquinol methylase